MKKIIFSLLFIGAASYANAQKSEVAEAKKLWGIFQFSMIKDPNADKKVVPAPKLSFVDKQIASLKEGLVHVDKAIVHEKTKDVAEAWLYKALFSSAIASVDTLDMANSAKYQKDAEEAITKTTALDTKGDLKQDLSTAKLNIRNTLVGRGLRAYNAKDYNASYDYFMNVLANNPGDTAMYMNAGVIAKLAGKYQESIQNFKKFISFNIPDAKNYYSEIINITLEKLKDTTAGMALLDEAIAKYPDDDALIGTQTDIYIVRGDIEKSQASLTKLIAKDPKKAIYQYLMGETYYKQALAMQEVRKKIDVKKVKEFDAISAKMLTFIDKGLPFYKKSHELDPKFVPALETLKQIYGFKNDTENFTDIKKKLDAIPQN